MSEGGKTRVQLDLSDRAIAELEQIRKSLALETRAETVRFVIREAWHIRRGNYPINEAVVK